MPLKRSRTWKAVLPEDPLERIMYFFSAIVFGLALVSLFGCASLPPTAPKEVTCLIRAPRPAKAPDTEFPGDEGEPAQPGALECYDPFAKKGKTIPFEEADKFVCRPPAGQREYDLYLKLRGL